MTVDQMKVNDLLILVTLPGFRKFISRAPNELHLSIKMVNVEDWTDINN